MQHGFAARSDAFDGNFGGRGGRPPEDPRSDLERLRIRELQQRCAARGYPEALGGGTLSNGDSPGWRKEQCIKVLEANVTAENRTRKIGDANKELSVDEMDRTDLYGVLARDFGVIPPMGTDTEDMRKIYKQRSAERDSHLAPPAPEATAALPVTIPTPVAEPVEPPLPAAGQLVDMKMPDLRQLAKKIGVNSFGKSKDALIPLLTEALNARKN